MPLQGRLLPGPGLVGPVRYLRPQLDLQEGALLKTIGGITVHVDPEVGLGWMRVPEQYDPADMRAALALIDGAGFIELDADETGDPYEFGDGDDLIVPLVPQAAQV